MIRALARVWRARRAPAAAEVPEPAEVTITVEVDTTKFTAAVEAMGEAARALAPAVAPENTAARPPTAPETIKDAPDAPRTPPATPEAPTGVSAPSKISAECNRSDHYDCEHCTCWCHPPTTRKDPNA